MEVIIDLLQAFHLNFLEVLIAALFVFSIGFFLDLNIEIQYSKNETTVIDTKVISIKQHTLKGAAKFAQ